MNQYERIVSYLYRYESGEKKENCGYARVERRESECRIQVQAKVSPSVSKAKAYLYIQKENGIQTVEIGNMQAGRGELRLKARTEVENLFGSGERFDNMDGIFISLGTDICFATTWKNEYFYQGDWNPGEREQERKGMENGESRQPEEAVQEETALVTEKVLTEERSGEEKEKIEEESLEKKSMEENSIEENHVEKDSTEEDRELQIQSVCGECPLKQKQSQNDYGYRILMTFPTMYPFKEMQKGSCVKMDLQDIGCLPMRFWSLSGNRFLLHGYYCYRHLLFLKTGKEKYAIGVPGIYNEKESRNSAKYGFDSFRPLGEDKRQGAFGYWMMNLE